MYSTEFKLPGMAASMRIVGQATSPEAWHAKQPTIALHGWLDNSESFTPLLPYLTQRPALAIDLPGHGYSDHRPPGSAYYFTEWVMDIVALIHQQGWQKVHLLGHSMGGFIAQLVAAVIPERVEQVTLIEAFGLLTYDATQTREKLRHALDERLKLAEKEPPIYADKERIVTLRARTSDLHVEQVRAIVERNLQAVEGGWSWRVDPRVRLGSPFRFTVEQATDLLAGIECPVQLIRGETGFSMLDQTLERWQHLVPLTHQVRLAGGHHLHLQQPTAVAEQINAFLRSTL